MLTISVEKGYQTHHLDIKGAFLHSNMSKTDSIWIPLQKCKYVSTLNGILAKLLKSLYGLRHAPNLWYQTMSAELEKKNFRPLQYSDFHSFAGTSASEFYIISYVHDHGILFIGTVSDVSTFTKKSGTLLTVLELGECSFFLGIKLYRLDDGLFRSQSSYNRRVVQEVHMSHCKPVNAQLPSPNPHYR